MKNRAEKITIGYSASYLEMKELFCGFSNTLTLFVLAVFQISYCWLGLSTIIIISGTGWSCCCAGLVIYQFHPS